MFTALFLLMAATVCSCSDKTFRDINYGTDVGSGFIPEVREVQPDGVEAQGSGGSGGVGSGGTGGNTGSGGADASAPDAAPDAVEAAGDDAETLDNS